MMAICFSLGLSRGCGVGVGAGGGVLNVSGGKEERGDGKGEGDFAPVRRTTETIAATSDNQRAEDFMKGSFPGCRVGFGSLKNASTRMGLARFFGGECLSDRASSETNASGYGAAAADSTSGKSRKYWSSFALSKIIFTASRAPAIRKTPPSCSRLCMAPIRTAMPELSMYGTWERSTISRFGFSSSIIARSEARNSGETWRSTAPLGAKTLDVGRAAIDFGEHVTPAGSTSITVAVFLAKNESAGRKNTAGAF